MRINPKTSYQNENKQIAERAHNTWSRGYNTLGCRMGNSHTMDSSPPPDPPATALQLRMIAKMDRLEGQVLSLSLCPLRRDDWISIPSTIGNQPITQNPWKKCQSGHWAQGKDASEISDSKCMGSFVGIGRAKWGKGSNVTLSQWEWFLMLRLQISFLGRPLPSICGFPFLDKVRGGPGNWILFCGWVFLFRKFQKWIFWLLR